MSNKNIKLAIKAENFKVFNAFLSSPISGVSISHDDSQAKSNNLPPMMAYDSAEDILNFIVTASWEIDKALLMTWIIDIIKNSNAKKTTINGYQIPAEHEDLCLFIKELIEKKQNESPDNSE